MEPLLTASQVAKELGVSRFTINNWRLKGLPAYPINGKYRFKMSDVEAWTTGKVK